MIVLLTACTFISGSLMFSYWFGLLAKKNIKTVGDGNPGALNLWKASGYKWGIAGLMLDFLKGYLPLAAVMLGSGYAGHYGMIPIAVAPIAGHAFSPFLKGKGGKAIAVTFGVWSAITWFEASLAYAVILAVMVAVTRVANKGKPISSETDGLHIVCGMLLLLVYLAVRPFAAAVLWVWAGSFLILAYKHRRELASFIRKKTSKNDFNSGV
ncbi:glycerol-3-phosphate acyltransferase [Paenibacillus protaetiae]|uniref:Glycerol-3-phosphate acyltransferase n=1 Tax=Paenibacillus protaetiae TaxID=2509456 RepID=A0A4P6EXW2_9BACL|nr:glycerol-3-phosphate acyltransferase [Paenibacillus protaetiae]QAY65457.1 glycerol-3-phosphate acyltransferase [Paenibacillus protaetiae]